MERRLACLSENEIAFKELKTSSVRYHTAGVDLHTEHYYLCILTGMSYTPEYHPITKAEFEVFEKLDYKELLRFSNRGITKLENGMYKFQWASKWNPLNVIATPTENKKWRFELKGNKVEESKDYKWDELILNAYEVLKNQQDYK